MSYMTMLNCSMIHRLFPTYFPQLFDFFERVPFAEHGTPGSLVHLIEKADTTLYAGSLVSSLERKPVQHTLWMANRLLNNDQVTDPLRSSLLAVLKSGAERPLAGELVRQAAKDFLEYRKTQS
jgi:hypothetical protein